MNFLLWKGITVELSSQLPRRAGVSRGLGKASALSVVLLGLGAMGGVQAATLMCGAGNGVHVTTTAAPGQWTSDAREVEAASPHADIGPATVVTNYVSTSWGYTLPTAIAPNAAWLTHGAVNPRGTDPSGYPWVDILGDRTKGAWVANQGTFIYNEPITVDPKVNLSTIKVIGKGSYDNAAPQFSVMAHSLPGGVNNLAAAEPWVQSTVLSGMGAWNSAAGGNFSLNPAGGSGLGFYYGDNSIGLSFTSERYNDGAPGGMIADFEITADCLTDVPPPPTAALICPMGNKAGDPVKIGPFYTNARDWKWARRTNAAGTALEDVPSSEQTLYDDYMWSGYFRPANLPAGQSTLARWISPGTTSPGASDVPGVPYPAATGMAKAGFYGSVFTMNQPITVGNNINMANIRLEGRFGFDDTGDSVFVQPVGSPVPTSFPSNLLNDGFGAFTTLTTAPTQGFKQGQNIIGLVLNGGQVTNDCRGGVCALAAIAEFYVTGVCTGDAPVDTPPTPSSVTPVPTLDLAGLGLLGLLGAGMGAFALRRRKREQ